MFGKTISHYHILEKLGEGGMGVVYKARDTHLDRFVALKILPPERMADPDRKRRFVQEAKAASSLHHPHIVTIFDIDEADGVHFIAMEYVQGKTLDQLIPRHGMRLNEGLKVSVQIADALAAAHAGGIVHRDLKPANVMVNENGVAKILDFGLAKLAERTDSSGSDTKTIQACDSQTDEGTILGTVSYMSPEQAEGKKIDARSDIFSFGSVMYEMATGQRAFQGDSKMSTLAAILNKDPKRVTELSETIPAEMEKIINRCLRKDPNRRIQTMVDLKVTLQELKEESELKAAAKSSVVVVSPSRRLRRYLLGLTLLLVLVIGVAIWFATIPSNLPAMKVVRLTSFPGKETEPALSPDGKMVAFVWGGEKGDNADIYGMLVDSGRPVRLTTDPGHDFSPAWSPDGRFIAFERQSKGTGGVYLIPGPYREGPERKLPQVEASPILGGRFLDWSPDGQSLVVSEPNPNTDRYRLLLLSVETGEKKQVTLPDSSFHYVNPAVSPDGRTLAFTSSSHDVGGWDTYTMPLQGGKARRLTSDRGSMQGVWSADGREIIFAEVNGGLYRVSVDGGKPRPLGEGGQFGFFPSVSREGNRLVYSEEILETDIWRIDLSSSGTAGTLSTELISSSQQEDTPDFSPDGKKIAFGSTRSGSMEIWVCDSDGHNPLRLTSMGNPHFTGTPRWAPDGKLIAFDSTVNGASDVFVISPQGGSPRRLTKEPSADFVPSWSRDGKWIYFCSDRNRKGDWQVWKMPAEGGPASQVTQKGGWEAVESFDRKFLFYSKPGAGDKIWKSDEIWKIPVAGGEEQLFLKGVEVRYRTLSEKGMYFLSTEDSGLFLKFVDFATLRLTKIMRLEKKLSRDPVGGLALSPDGRSLLCTLVERDDSDLVLIENFR